MDEQATAHPKFYLLLTQFVLALVAFSSLSVTKYLGNTSLEFALGMLTAYWVLLTITLFCMGTGRCPIQLQPAVAEVALGGCINILLFVAFVAIAAAADEVNAKVSAGFAFFLWAFNIGSLYMTVDACRGNDQPSSSSA